MDISRAGADRWQGTHPVSSGNHEESVDECHRLGKVVTPYRPQNDCLGRTNRLPNFDPEVPLPFGDTFDKCHITKIALNLSNR